MTASSLAARAVTAILGFATIPLLVSGLGRHQYGVYAAVVSLSAFFVFADQGLAVSARTYVAQSVATGDALALRASLRATWRMMLAIVVALVAGLGVAAPFVPWAVVVPGASPAVVLLYLVPAVVLLCATVPLRALEGVGRSALVARLPILGSAWLLGTVAIGVALDRGIRYFLVTAALTSLPALLFASRALHRALPDGPRDVTPSDRELVTVRRMWTSSWPIALVSVMLSVSYSTHPIILSSVLGPAATADYAVTFKLYSLGLTVVTAGYPVLWTHFATARAAAQSHRIPWRGVVLLVTLAVVIAVGLASCGPFVIRHWAGEEFRHSRELLVAMGALLVAIAVQLVPAAALTDDASLRFQVWTTTAMAVANVPLSLVLAHSWGVSGPVWASVVSLVAFHASILWWRFMRKQPRPTGPTLP
ncbi:MAG TPA: oligosaccharide flippase family protein [Nocardioides sp.]|uniref:lipopolysaccharide biosynthesis protein n=1 Tax=Nocardioides sp. TaxID=35761 RepID=UPI002ED7A58B